MHFALTPAEVGSAFGGRRNFKQRILEAQVSGGYQTVAAVWVRRAGGGGREGGRAQACGVLDACRHRAAVP